MTKRVLLALMCTFVLMGCFTIPGFAATNPDVTVNGTFVNWTDARPFIDQNNRTMVPLRASMEACGLQVTWDGAKREAAVTDGYTIVKVPIDKRVITINGKNKNIDTNAVIKGSRTYLPIRAVAEAFGYNVCWSDSDKLVSLIKLDRYYDYYMEYSGIWIGRFSTDLKGNAYLHFYYTPEEDLSDVKPTSMFTYNNETIIKYNGLLVMIGGMKPRMVTSDMIVYLDSY